MDWYGLRLNRALSDAEFGRLLEQAEPDRQKRIQSYLRPRDAQRSLLGDALARWGIRRTAGLPGGAELAFGRNEYGKPFLLRPEAIHFNVSHSGDWVVCAVDSGPVGIDVEEIRTAPLDIADRFFTAEEREDLEAVSPERKNEHFYRLWTRKESYMKAVGIGLSLGLENFSVHADTGIIAHPGRQELWLSRNFKLDDRHMLALCGRPGSAYRRHLMELDEFMTLPQGG